MQYLTKGLLLSLLFLATQCTNPKPTEKQITNYLFYLHGRIIEDQGINAISEKYGPYEYTQILKALEQKNIKVISEARKKDTDITSYAKQITQEIRTLLQSGVSPKNICVLGASKGSVITMLVSTQLANPAMKFILMGNCNDWVLDNFDMNLQGHILSIYEKSDEFGKSCDSIIATTASVSTFKEIALETNLGHGFLYKPLKEWIQPALTWTKEQL